jgi:hypothetical protein
MLDHRAEYYYQYVAFLCVGLQVQNLGEPGPVVTSFAKHPGYGHPSISDEKFNVTVPSGMYLSAIVSVWILCWTLLLFLYDGGQLKSLCIHLILSRI